MICDVHDDRKTVEVWLTNQEQGDDVIQGRLKQVYRKYSAQKYMVVVFLSGKDDLVDLTSGLLRSNRDRMARREVEQERMQRVKTE